VLESRRGSGSLLQRRLMIGYSRASRLIDQMAGAGIVGHYKGSQARKVLITSKQWEALQGRIGADREGGCEADQDEDQDIIDTLWDQSAPDPTVSRRAHQV
ncbi:MAG: DNA translocase FtsK, partial [Phycisphaerae bacterium]